MTGLLAYVYIGSAVAVLMMLIATESTPGLLTPLMILIYPVAWPLLLLEALRRYYTN
jgi:hypothetical protein